IRHLDTAGKRKRDQHGATHAVAESPRQFRVIWAASRLGPGREDDQILRKRQARLAAMGHVICDLKAADIDRLEGLWRELLEHHLAAAPHLAALGTARDPADSWRVRRAQYLQWLAAPEA